MKAETVEPEVARFTASRPGSLAWLLGKQLAWQWRGLTRGRRALVWILLALAVLIVGASFFALRPMLAKVPLNGPLPSAVLGPLLLAQTFLFTLMLSAAVRAALESLFTRGDLDLLLHSPISPGVVLASRALGVAFTAALASALLVVPALLLALALGAWRGLGLLGWWAAASLLAASAGLWLTLGLVRWLGVRRTRTVSSVVGALLGAGFFLLTQWGNLSGRPAGLFESLALVAPGWGGWPGRESLLWFSARAAWLEPLPTVALLALGVGVFALSVLALTRQFTFGAQELAAPGGRHAPARSARGHLRFARAPRATLLKEWRLIWRDPELLSRTLLQVVYLLPLLFSLGGGRLRAGIGTGVVLLSASLTRALADLTLNAEDAPDLLVGAPRSPAALRRDKWLAAVIPTALLGLLALTVLASRGALGLAYALPLLPLLLLGSGGTALMVLWQPLPVRRADAFRRRQSAPLLGVLLTLVFQGGLSASAFALGRGALWGLLTLAAALIALGVAYGLRRSDVR